MQNDPIVDQVHETRAATALRFNNDLKAISDDARKRQAASGRKTIALQPRLVKSESSEAAKKAG